jgi:hypothetical protein
MCKIKDYTEQHPDERFSGANPEDLKVARDEDTRLDYQQQREEEQSDSADHFFAPSEGY